MRTAALIRSIRRSICSVVIAAATVFSQVPDDAFKSSFAAGREYFTLRSGTAKLIIEANNHGTAPAVTYLVFDANKPCQTLRKERALNYVPGKGCSSSALEVILGGVAFSALGHTTTVHWGVRNGVPAVEAQWWAGGIEVTESYFSLHGANAFLREIRLHGKDLAGPDSVRLRLALPPGSFSRDRTTLVGIVNNTALAIAILGGTGTTIDTTWGVIESLPIRVDPESTVCVTSALLSSIPARGYPYDRNCAEGQPIPILPLDEVEARAGQLAPFLAVDRFNALDPDALLASTRAFWENATRITTTDSLVQSLFDHARFALPGMVGPNGTMDAGIFEYGNQWVRDGSNVALGLIHAGYFESARALLGFIVRDLVSSEGTTVVAGGFDDPDREEFDQMGELVHVLKVYRDWTGDSSLIVEERAKLIAMIERPLRPAFRDSTGMVHNHREFWERTFDDAYELAYQTLMVRGLRDAADLSDALAVPGKAQYWREQADVFLHAMLHHPSRSLTQDGTLIKRRNVDGSVADLISGAPRSPGREDPASTESHHRLNPDASTAIPIFLRVIDPSSPLARKTLDALESIWNGRWNLGGYERYHSSSQQDQPGPWTFATTFLARAQHDAGLHARSRRSLEWLLHVQGGNAGAWFEEIPLIRSQMSTSGILPWTSAELTLFGVRHWLGVSFEGRDLVIHPNLFPQRGGVTADLRFRSSRIRLVVDKPGAIGYALVNGRKVIPRKDGSIVLPGSELRGDLEIAVFAAQARK